MTPETGVSHTGIVRLEDRPRRLFTPEVMGAPLYAPALPHVRDDIDDIWGGCTSMVGNNPVAEAWDFPQGTPVYDSNGDKLGTVSAYGIQSGYLVMQKGMLFHHDVSLPISAIQRSDAHGVYLNRTRQDIHDLTLGGWSSLGNVDLNTGIAAGADLDVAPTILDSGDDAKGRCQ